MDGGTLTNSSTISGLTTVNGGTLELDGGSNAGITSTGTGTVDVLASSTVSGTFTNGGGITSSGGGALAITGLTSFISSADVNGGAGSLAITTGNATFQDGHSETGTVTYNATTLTEERTGGGGTYSGGYGAANLATNAAGVFTTGGDTTTTGNSRKTVQVW